MRFPLLLFALFPTVIFALPPTGPIPPEPEPELPDGTAAAERMIPTFKLPAGMKVELFAAEPKLGSPVAIALDEKNRVFVAEEYRFNRGTQENRDNVALKTLFFLEDDLQIQTLADRLKVFEKWKHKFPGGMDWFSKHADQIRLLQDTTGDGKADKSTVFAGGFNHPLDGLGAGVMATNGDVYYTCIPNLWRLRDTDGDGVADQREALLTGFGVNLAFLGHDLHGLIWGPDGKLYFSVGDRGFNVTTKEGTHLVGPRTGAVFRCDPDGANLEVVHRGLRNPQELAFDQFGNLFADDNNCDKGDDGRLVYIVEGGDSGWNMAYQTIPAPYVAGPWFAERMWHDYHPGQPAWIVPRVGKIGTGPSGFLFTSGTSLPDRYRNSFLMCNYTGNGGLESFKVKPKGAGFEIDDYHDFLKPIRATDAEFGYDGKLYISDFVNLDWTGKSLGGRIYTVFDSGKITSTEVLETKKLFAEGFGKLSDDRLLQLLGHADQRVRLRAQFTLAERARQQPKIRGMLTRLAHDLQADRFARLHAIWAIGQSGSAITISLLQKDPDPEIRGQVANVQGWQPTPASSTAAPLLEWSLANDPSPRVKFFAAQTLGKMQSKSAIPALFEVLAANADADPFLRHACVTALARIGDAEAVQAKASDPAAAVRMAVVLVQRKLGDKRVSQFLTDADPFVRTEAARAVHDLPLESEYPALARLLPTLGKQPAPDLDPLVRRAISAAFRLGGAENAKAVLGVVTNPNFSMPVRTEALAALRDWSEPPPRDRVTGFWRPLAKRDSAELRSVVEAELPTLLAKTSGKLQVEVIGLILKLGLKADEATFAGWVADPKVDSNTRVAALRFLAERRSPGLEQALAQALADASPRLRAEARDLLVTHDPQRGAKLVADVACSTGATVLERQRAIATLTRLPHPLAANALDALAESLANGQLPPELHLDVQEALKAAPSPKRNRLLTQFESRLPTDLVGRFQISLVGGDAERGRDIFFGHTAAQCVRCHRVQGVGGVAGPDLTEVAKRNPDKTREYLLESLTQPSAKIAPGYAGIAVTTIDGQVIAGTLLADDASGVTVKTSEGKTVRIPADDIDARTTPQSPMPAIDRTLTPREMRDLIEFLASLK